MRLLCLLLLPVFCFADPLSPRKANYDIHVKFDPTAKTLTGTETITWRHEGVNPLAALQFHLYWNAFRDGNSTFMRESAHSGGDAEPSAAGSMEITSLRLNEDAAELAPTLRYIHPDDENALDRTVAEIPLEDPIAPGDAVTITIHFTAKFPGLIARAGTEKDFFMAGQWFPKIGVVQRDLWNTHQYHFNSEFFADFGVYRVELTLPAHYVVAASGDLVASTSAGNLKTLTYVSEDVHDFAWSAWPKFRKMQEQWRGVRIELYYPPEHTDAARHMVAAKATLEWFDRNIGPYPYPRLIVVDVPDWATEAGGMEYPTLVTTETPRPALPFFPSRLYREPELVTIHEIGHQYFYGMLASNEFEEAWLDEGINTFAEAAIADSLYGSRESLYSLPPFRASDAGYEQRGRFLSRPVLDPVVQPAWRYATPNSYGDASYSRPLFILRTVEELVGHEKMYRGLRHYFDLWRFKHPTTRDFIDALKEGTGQDLNWFLQQALYTTGTLDYSIERVQAVPNRTVRVVRLGEIVMPVTLTVHFDGKPDERLYWDGRERWHDFTMQSPGVIAGASINAHALDANPVNNSYSPREAYRGGWKLVNLWAFVVQHLLELVAWLV